MPLLGPTDELPHSPKRVLVAGTSGAGKSTMAGCVADVLGLSYVEMDSLFHGPQWTPRPEFEADVRELVKRETWATEWQYTLARPLLLARADTLIWLDHAKHTVLRRVVVRTVVRRVRRVQLWNGNTEPPLRTVFTDREHLLRWAWKSHGRTRDRIAAVLAGEHGSRLAVVRLRGQREVDQWRAGPLRRAAERGEESVR
ncbi:adenylate kinase family enzyme [Saccharothrix tamanrassetensis]|uniref:Adenylate kinase family enzyme n=1 Tax=Saccharothrix tamanrassetensis TaxID=1051531 RepID=A0A841CBR0_9PSEU|nr:AAA family ATPase [Saccharothrix tamanrassetensis]MBB5955952.1 adenylate kinase family enzyme [Saccharothrix tamanrassetensis]